jgi:large subunit ribosomal protein L29
MKISEIKELSTSDLLERLDTEKTMLVRLKLNHAISPLDNPQKIRQARKTIARLMTELRTRESISKQSTSK